MTPSACARPPPPFCAGAGRVARDRRRQLEAARGGIAPAGAMAPVVQPAEIQFAQRLASSEKGVRDRAVRKLRQYLSVKTQRETGGRPRVSRATWRPRRRPEVRSPRRRGLCGRRELRRGRLSAQGSGRESSPVLDVSDRRRETDPGLWASAPAPPTLGSSRFAVLVVDFRLSLTPPPLGAAAQKTNSIPALKEL